jgi:hypothetical protein
LVGAPGVDLGEEGEDVVACSAHRFPEKFTVDQTPVERFGKTLAGPVIDCPTGGDDGLDAHTDEFFAEVGGEQAKIGIAPAIHPSEVTTVDEDQFRYPAHLLDVARGQDGVGADHHPRTRLRHPLGAIFMDAMPGEMEDAPFFAVQCFKNGRGFFRRSGQ